MLPLSGITVVDLTRILAGPYCTMKLGDMGAEVIKIERPGLGDDTRSWAPPYVGDQSAYYFSVNRNKKSVALDLATPEGGKVLAALIREADVLVDNFRPGVLARMGFSTAKIARLNSRIVHCTISAYGPKTRRSNDPAYELIVQGESGLMDLTGFPDGPPAKVGISISDITTGNNAFEGILLALLRRERTGRGARIHVSLLESILAAFTYQAQIALSTRTPVRRMGNLHPTITPYETFQTKDGYINIAVTNDRTWKAFCGAISRAQLSAEKKFATNPLRVKNRSALKNILTPLIHKRSSRYWLKLLADAGVPAGKVNTLAEALRLPEVTESGIIRQVRTGDGSSTRTIGNPIRISGAIEKNPSCPPHLGQHTADIVKRLNRRSPKK